MCEVRNFCKHEHFNLLRIDFADKGNTKFAQKGATGNYVYLIFIKLSYV